MNRALVNILNECGSEIVDGSNRKWTTDQSANYSFDIFIIETKH